MDSSTVFYIIAVIIYFIYTSFAKRKSDNSNPEMEEKGSPPKQGPSFEDLLREIRTGQNQKKAAENEEELEEQKPDTTPSLPKTERKLVEEARNLADEVEVGNAYRDIKQPLVKLDDQVDLSDGQKLLGDVVDVAGEYPGGNKYARLLKSPETKKDVVVLTEIFNRKHF
jgi:hypothetical protein